MGLTRPRLGQFQTTTAAFDDPIVVFNNNTSGSNTKDIGIVFERGDDQNKVLLWDESADEFVLANSTEQGSTSGNVTLASYASLHINDLTLSGSIASLTVNDAFTFPTTDGTAGYVLTTNGSGTVSWSASASSGHTIQNAGSDLTTRTNLNFDGTYLVATDDAVNDQNDVTVSSNLQTWHGKTAPSGTVVGTTDTQTLTNKTLTSPNITGLQLSGTTVTATATELNYTDGVTSNIQTQLNNKGTVSSLSDLSITATATEINKLDGVTATTTELNYTDGVTSNIQTQLNAKASLSGATFTGTVSGTNLTLSGNLTVNGTTTTLNTTNTVVSDNLIELNNGVSSNANDSGIVIERGSTGNNAFMGWDESADQFIVGTTTATGSSTGNLTVTASKLTVATPTASSDAATKGYVDTQVSGTVSSLSDLGVTATASELNYVDGVTSNVQTQLDGKLSTSGGTVSGNLTVSGQINSTGNLSLQSGAMVVGDSGGYEGIYFENDKHAITWNDSWGNFNLRVGNNGINDENCTENGYIFQDEWSQSGGWREFNVSSASLTVGDAPTWRPQIYFDYNKVSLRYQGSAKLETTSSGVTVTGEMSGTATSAQYADLAEKYMPDGVYQPGTVLQFGGVEEVTIANEYATHRVAGVVSTDPAYMMNSALEDGVYIALQGRVPCRVVGTCEKGDLMVTSNTDGCAVAWTESFSPPYGSVIGKALENKQDNNESVIEVVVGVR